MESPPSTAASAAAAFVEPSAAIARVFAFTERRRIRLRRLRRRLRRLFRDERANGVDDGASLGGDVQLRVARFRGEDGVESTS